MAITVQNLLELSSLQEFRLVAGRAGLSNLIEKTGIVDYEFVDGFAIDEELAFEKNSIVISSLLFAKDSEEALLRAVKRLIRYGVSALGIKTIFYKEIPEQVKTLADQENFAVFLFDKAYFEDIIAEIRQAVSSDQLLSQERECLQRLYDEGLSPRDVKELGCELHPALQKWVKAYYCETEHSYNDWEISRVLSGFASNGARKQETAAFYFQKGFLFLVSSENKEEKRFYLQFCDALHCAGLAGKNFIIGESAARLAETDLNLSMLEAVCAQRGAMLREVPFLRLEDLGILRLLLWPGDGRGRKRYAQEYLEPVRRLEQEGSAELLNTAVFYVQTGGSIPETAKKLFVHGNTVRYRIARIRERLNPGASDCEFFHNLASAIWIMLAEKRELI